MLKARTIQNFPLTYCCHKHANCSSIERQTNKYKEFTQFGISCTLYAINLIKLPEQIRI